ncbi:MAG: hypothetical protein AAGL66_07455 [Pseudomonadota bacterium]
MDPTSAVLMTFGVALLLVSWILLLVAAWQDDYAWGLFATLLPPVAYIYAFFRLEKAGQSLLVAAIGWLCVIFAL